MTYPEMIQLLGVCKVFLFLIAQEAKFKLVFFVKIIIFFHQKKDWRIQKRIHGLNSDSN